MISHQTLINSTLKKNILIITTLIDFKNRGKRSTKKDE